MLDRNLQKTLDLVWLLILHYHISCGSLSLGQATSVEPTSKGKHLSKQSMLVWVNAVLSGRTITNFSTDWSSGESLVALVNYCKPGLIDPSAYSSQPFERMSLAIQLAQTELEVPEVLSPGDLFVDQPDERSVMTYLSYFCRINSPGEKALLHWVHQQIPNAKITNLTTDWESGVSLGALVNKLTRNGFQQYNNMYPIAKSRNCQESMKQAETLLGIPFSVSAEDFSSSDLAYLSRLAYLVQFYAAQRGEPVQLKADVSKVQVSSVNRGEEGGVKKAWIDLDCSKAGQAEVHANASTKAGKHVNVSVSELESDQYRVKFLLEDGVEVYILSIHYGEEEVNGSPFYVNLATADAAKVQHVGTDVPTEDKQTVVLGFDAKEAGYGKLTATASGECAGPVTAELSRKPNGGFDVVFTPPIPDVYSVDVKWGKFIALAKGKSCGTIPVELLKDANEDLKLSFEPPSPDVYTVDVTWGGKPVPGSPFTINLLPPAKPENVEVGDPLYGEVGEEVDFVVDVTHAGSGKLTASCRGEKVENVATSIVPISRKAYKVTFLASELDVYYLSIFFEGVPIQGSPFRINLLQKERSVQVPQPEYKKDIGAAMTIPVECKDKKAKITATAYGDMTGACRTLVQKSSSGNYDVILDPEVPDIYTVNILLNNTPIPNSPFIVNYLPRTIPDHTRCRLLDFHAKELTKKLFDIDSDIHLSVDTHEAGQSTLEVSVEAPDGKQYEVDVKHREDEPKGYDIAYTPTVAGTHYLKILWGGKPIPQSPLSVRVVDYGKVQNFLYGKTASLDIDIPSDVKEKDIKVRVLHAVSGTIAKISGRLSKGKYHVTFSPKQPGLYSIYILIKDKELPSNPLVIRYGDAPRPDRCIVQDFPEQSYAKTNVTFTIDASKCGSGEIYVKIISRNLLRKDKSKVTWKESTEVPSTYVVTFTPASTGEHSLLITWAGKPIRGTPHNIRVVEKPPEVSIPTAELYTMDLLSTPQRRERVNPIPEVVHSSIGQALFLRVTIPQDKVGLLSSIGKGLKSIFKEEFIATATGKKTGPADITVKENRDGTYDVIFAPGEPDKYTISIHYEDEEIANSPITAVFDRAPTDPSKVEIIGMSDWEVPIPCFVHQEFKFEVSTKGAGVGAIRVKLEAPGTEGDPLVKVKEDGKHRYNIRYVPRTIGMHLLHLLWDDIAIPSSPITINVVEPPVVQPGQAGIFEIRQGKWKFSEIKSIGTHLDTGKEYEVKRSQTKGKYVFSLHPDEPGNYEIVLRVGGIDICRPFRFRFDRPSLPDKVVVFGFQDEGVIKETIKFRVDVSDAGIGPLKVTANGPGKTKTSVSDIDEGIHTIIFSASSPGSYTLEIMWNGEEIPGSPFDIEICVANNKKNSTGSPRRGWKWNWGQDRSKQSDYSIDTDDILEELGSSLDHFVTGILGYFGRSSVTHTEITSSGSLSSEASSSSAHAKKTQVKQLKEQSSKVSMTIGRVSRWEIDTTELDGDLEVTATGAKTGNVEISLTQIREGLFQAVFSPKKADQYTISIMVNGQHLPNSPVIINYEQPQNNSKSVKIVGLQKIPPLITVGQKIRVIVDARDGGLGALTVDPKTPPSKERTHILEIDNFNDDPGMYDVTYTPCVVGKHSLEIFLAKNPISSSPINLRVCDPKLVTYSFATKSAMKIGQLIKMQCDTSQAGYDELTATCTGTNTGDISVSVTKSKGKNKYDVSFKPEVEDLYILEVKLGPYHINGSPFRINLSSFDVEKVIVTGPLQPDGPQGPVKLTANVSDLPRGKLVSVCKYKKTSVSVTVKETYPNIYSLAFQPVEPAQYTWSVTYQGQHIPGSPFFIDTKPRPEKAVVVTPQSGVIGQFVHFEVDVSTAGMGRLTATCKGKKTKKVPVEITQVRQGVFSISFLPFSYDTYTMYVQWSGKELPNSPFVFELKPLRRKTVSKHFNVPIPLPKMEDTSAVEISCIGEKFGTVAAKLIPVSANKYQVSFKPQGPDLYTLSVLYNDLHVKGSPYSIDLRVPDDGDDNSSDGETQDLTITEDEKPGPVGPGLKNTIGSALIVRVRPQKPDQKNGELKATAVGNETGKATIHVEKFSNDYFQVTFNPKQPDTYTVSITLNGEPIPRSPFIVHYHHPPVRPSMVKIIGLQDIQSILEVNKEVSVVIDATQAGAGTFQAVVRGPDDSRNKPKLEVKPREDEPGMYIVTFLPVIRGVYTLSLYWDHNHIPNSPMKLQVVDFSTAKRYSSSKEIALEDFEIPNNPADITAYAVCRDSATRLNVNVKEIKKHRYRIVFRSNEPGFYFLHVFALGEELPVSPIPIYISKPSQAEKCVVKTAPSVAYLKEEITMLIDCNEGGEGSVEVKVVEPKGSEKPLSTLNNQDGTYTISYVPFLVGTHFFHITWSGQPIPKSPYQVEVRQRDQDEFPVNEISIVDRSGQPQPFSGQEEVNTTTDRYFSFSFRLTEEQGRKFSARAISKGGDSFDLRLLESIGGLFKFGFKPPSPGLYTLDFSLGDRKLKLPQLPKRFIFTEPPADAAKVKIVKHTIPGLLQINRKIFFQVDTTLAGNGSIDFKFEGPSTDKADLHIQPTPGKPYFYDVWFTPVESGVYHLEVLWGGTILPGFPIMFNVVSTSTENGKSSSSEIAISGSAKDITCYAINITTGEKNKVKFNQVSKGVYRFTFRPQTSGSYDLHVFSTKKEIPGSPFRVTYGQPPQSWNVVVKYLQTHIQVKSVVKFVVDVKKAGDGDLNIKLTAPKSQKVPKLYLKEKKEGIYEAEFTPRISGQYSIQITWAGKEVPNSPFVVNALESDKSYSVIKDWIDGIFDEEPPAIADKSIPLNSAPKLQPIIQASDLHLFGKSLSFGKISFTIAHYGFPGGLEIQSRGPKDLRIRTIEGSDSNTYEIDPQAPGKYELTLLWNGQVIGRGPYMLLFEKPRTIGGFSLQDQTFQVGKSYQYTICTDNISPGVMEINCDSHDAAEVRITAAKESREYQFSLIPKLAGDFRIAVCYNGIDVQGSPFLVHFKDASPLSVNFNLFAEGIETGDISAILQSVATQQMVPISLNQLFGGENQLEFLPTEGNEYTLTITCGLKIKREQVSASVFNLTYLAMENNASMCRIEGDGITAAALGGWSKFVVDCRDGGPGELTAAVDGDGAEVKVVSLSEYKYEVQYRISAVGYYQLKLQWGGQHILGSPFEISVQSAASTTTSSSMQVSLANIPHEVKATESIEFDMDLQDHVDEGDLVIEADTASGRKVSGKLSLSGANSYHVSIPTSESGDYSINIYYKGTPLLQQPLTVSARAPGECVQLLCFETEHQVSVSCCCVHVHA